MNKYTKLELIKLISTESVRDDSYWLFNKCVYKWNKKELRFISQSSTDICIGFKFEHLNDVVYELVDYEGGRNE